MSADIVVEPLTIEGQGVPLAAERFRNPSRPQRGYLLLLHGGGQTRQSWERSARAFADHGWNVLTVDARGHGDSGWAADGDYSPEVMVADLRAVVATFEEKPVLVGASMGAMMSVIAEGEHGNLARALVLVDWVPKIEEGGVQRIVGFMTSAPDGFASLEEAGEALRQYNPHRKPSGSLEGLKKILRQRADGRWMWHWDPRFIQIADEPNRGIHETRPREAARRITVPLLMVHGGQSDVVAVEGLTELKTLVPHAQFASVSEAGHMVAGDDNTTFSAAVLGFIDGLDQTSQSEHGIAGGN